MHTAASPTEASSIRLWTGGWRKWMLKAVAALVCFWALWRIWPADSHVFLAVRNRAGLLLAAVLLRPVFTLLLALRTTVLASVLSSPPPRARSVIRITFISQMFNLVMPGGVGGDVARGVLLQKLKQSRWTRVTGVLVFDRIVGLASLLVVVLVGAFPLLLRLWPTGLAAALGLALLAVLAIVLAVRSGAGRKLRGWLGRRPWARDCLEAVGGLTFRQLGAAGLLALLAHACLLFSCGLIFDSCGYAVPWSDRIGVLALSFLAASLPLTIGGHGVREGALVWLLSTGAINAGTPLLPRDEAVVVAVTLLCILVATNFATGMLALWVEGSSEGREAA